MGTMDLQADPKYAGYKYDDLSFSSCRIRWYGFYRNSITL